MPRKRKTGTGSGGFRQGAPGQAYSNRTDLNAAKTQPVRVAPAATYGDATAQTQAQQAVPLPGPGAGLPSPPAAGPGGTPQAAGPPAGPTPGALGPLNAPSARPGEPITAGLTSGPGPGPEAINQSAQLEDPTVSLLRGILAKYPSPDVQSLLNEALAAHG